jgi:hypothetical protein
MSYVFTYIFGKIGNYYTISKQQNDIGNITEASLNQKEPIEEKLSNLSASQLSSALLDTTLTASYNTTQHALDIQQSPLPEQTPIITISNQPTPITTPVPLPKPTLRPTPQITVAPSPSTVSNDVISEDWSKVSDILNNE